MAWECKSCEKESLIVFDLIASTLAKLLEDLGIFSQNIRLTRETIQPGLRCVSSGNFFLALNKNHHVLLKKG